MAKKREIKLLCKLIQDAQSHDLLEEFLQDLLTTTEAEQLQERWFICSHILEGQSQRKIKENLGISISKVTRGSALLKSGSQGFRKLWEKKNV